MVLSAAVSSGVITAVRAWPDVFDGIRPPGDDEAFPSTDADMSGFELEDATPGSFARDMDLMAAIAANQRLAVREEAPPPAPRLPDATDPMWP
ncbi:MAG: hypothetical protein JWM19_993 [Actinomycetia bacterium]|nr:hypothetical protein [Actinomycetes bacterium]